MNLRCEKKIPVERYELFDQPCCLTKEIGILQFESRQFTLVQSDCKIPRVLVAGANLRRRNSDREAVRITTFPDA